MSALRLPGLRTVLTALGVAAAWTLLFELNLAWFAATEHSARANWIFLPAALRLLAVLLFGDVGAIGLVIGAFYTLPPLASGELVHGMVLAGTSGLAPLIAVGIGRRHFAIASDLAGLRALHIVVLAISCAAANAIILNGYLLVTGQLAGDLRQIFTVFVGDVAGAAIVLLAISSSLALVLPRRRGA